MAWTISLLEIVTLNDYKLHLRREKLQVYLMRAILASALLFIPFFAMKSRVYCVHECFFLNSTLSSCTALGFTNSRYEKNLYCALGSEMLSRMRDHTCKESPGYEHDEVLDKILTIANMICPLHATVNQMLLSGGIVLLIIFWGAMQGIWVYRSEDSIKNLRLIRIELQDHCFEEDFVHRYLRRENFLRPDTTATDLLDQGAFAFGLVTRIEAEEALSSLERARNWRDSLQKVPCYYFCQNLCNILFGLLLLVLGREFEFENHFACNTTALHTSPSLRDAAVTSLLDIRCFNPDAVALQGNLSLIVVLLIFLIFHFTVCICKYKDVVVSLYRKLQTSDGMQP